MRRFICRTALLIAAALAVTPAAALADYSGPQGTVSLSQPAYVAHENQGVLTITITRTQIDHAGWIYYGVHRQDALPGLDFWPVPGTQVHFAAGESSVSFNVHIIDNGINSTPVHAMAYLYGSDSANVIGTGKAQVTILRDDPLDQRDPLNPLALPGTPPNGNVLFHVPFYVAGDESPAGRARAHTADRATAQALSVIADEPVTKRFWFWNTPAYPAALVTHYLERAEYRQPGTVVQLSTYSVVHGHCNGHWSDPPGLVARYQHWIDGLANGIGNYRVVMFFELDSLITANCLSREGLRVRLEDELRPAIERLEQQPHVVLYLDAGAADALPWRRTASLLRRAGVQEAQGFALNATHFDWTTTELHYGQRIARALGGKHFVINTGENGRGPLVPHNRVQHGNEVLCNPPGRGLGPQSTDTGYLWADAFLWFSNPGGSAGPCRPGAPATGIYWPAYAVMLVRNAVYKVTGPRYHLLRAPQSAGGAPA
jgi:endoglucanase